MDRERGSPAFGGVFENRHVTITYRRAGVGFDFDLLAQDVGWKICLEQRCLIGIRRLSEADENTEFLFVKQSTSEGGAGSTGSTDEHRESLEFCTFCSNEVPRELSEPLADAYQSQSLFHHALSKHPQTRPPIYLIVSTGSGTGRAPTVAEKLVEPFLAHLGLEKDKHFQVFYTSSPQSLGDFVHDSIAKPAINGQQQLVILLSGDGGVVDLVNSCLSTDAQKSQVAGMWANPVVALIPCGTGNALAHSSGITSDSTMGLRTLFRGMPLTVPLFKVDLNPGAQQPSRRLGADNSSARCIWPNPISSRREVYGAVVFSWGFHAALVADSDTIEYRKHGASRFQMAAKENLFPPDGTPMHKYLGTVSLLEPEPQQGGQGEWNQGWMAVQRHGHYYVLATLVSQLERGFLISPASKPLESQLRVIHFGPPDKPDGQSWNGELIMQLMKEAYDGGKHINSPNVDYVKCNGLRIRFEENDSDTEKGPAWRRVCVDGTIFTMPAGSEVTVTMLSSKACSLDGSDPVPKADGIIDLLCFSSFKSISL